MPKKYDFNQININDITYYDLLFTKEFFWENYKKFLQE